MSIGDIVVVPMDILKKADDLIRVGTRGVTAANVHSVRSGVELLLQNNLVLSFGADNAQPVKVLVGQADASSLLKKGLTLLSNTPFETLEINIGARTQDIRKAYKKLALKYHPDKNPRTTPLFQVIHAACEKLSDKEQRLKEETKSTARARQQDFAVPQAGPGFPPRQAPRAPAPPKFEQQQRSEGYYHSSNPTNTEDKFFKQQQSFSNNGPGAYKSAEDAAKEQSRKADSDRRAKEYAAKCANDLLRRREMEAAQMAKYREDVRIEREAMLKKAQDAYSHFKQQTFESKLKSEAAQQAAASAAANASKQAGGGKDNHREARQSTEQRPLPGQANGRVPPPIESSKNGPTNPPSSKPNLFVRVPVPFGLKCASIGVDTVELEWKTSSNHMHSLSVELNWKNRAMGLRVWESSSKLINCGRCRKKNLAPGSVYEFRIRAVEELVGGMLGNRSEWTESILVTLLQPSNTNTNPTTTSERSNKGAAAAAVDSTEAPVFSRFGSNRNINHTGVTENVGAQAQKVEGQSAPLGQMPSFHFQRFSTHHTPAEEVKSVHGKPNPPMDSPNTRGEKSDETSRSQSAGKKKGVQVEVGDLKEGMKKKGSSRYMEKGGLSASAKQAWGQWAQFQADSDAAKAAGSDVQEDNDDVDEEVEEEVSNFDEEKDADDESSDEAKSVGDDEEDDLDSDGGSIDEKDDESEDIVDEEEEVSAGTVSGSAPPAGIKVHYSNESNANKSQSSSKPIHRPKVNAKKAAAAHKERAAEKKASVTVNNRKVGKETKPSNVNYPKKEQSKVASDDNDDNYSNIFDEERSSEGEVEEWFQLKLPKELSTNKEKDGSSNGRYPVRAEPFSKSKVVGYLVPGVAVVATADCGDWLKVKIHTTDKEEDPSTKNAPKKQQQQAMAWEWGWCLRRYKDQEFLVSANGIIIDDVVEALNLNAHYNMSKDAKKKKDSDKHKSISPDALPTDSDAARVKSSKESRFSPPLFDGKENNSHPPPQQAQSGDKKDSAELSPPLSNISSATSESISSSAQDDKGMFLRSNSIRLPPINSPTPNKKQKSFKSKSSKKNKSDKGSTEKEKEILPSEPPTAARREEKNSEATVSAVPIWSELKDPSGHIYYYNAATKESKWEPPEWIQEWDVSSGAYYYIHYSDESGHKFSPKSLHSTWTKPAKYSKLKKYT